VLPAEKRKEYLNELAEFFRLLTTNENADFHCERSRPTVLLNPSTESGNTLRQRRPGQGLLLTCEGTEAVGTKIALPWVLGSREVHRGGGVVDEQAGVQSA
jgi:hypothetical protein